jgi:hypothetical protein
MIARQKDSICIFFKSEKSIKKQPYIVFFQIFFQKNANAKLQNPQIFQPSPFPEQLSLLLNTYLVSQIPICK